MSKSESAKLYVRYDGHETKNGVTTATWIISCRVAIQEYIDTLERAHPEDKDLFERDPEGWVKSTLSRHEYGEPYLIRVERKANRVVSIKLVFTSEQERWRDTPRRKKAALLIAKLLRRVAS